MAKRRKIKVFVSYSRHDEAFVRPLSGLLGVAADDAVFLDVERIKPGELWEQEIMNAVRESSVFVICWCCQSRKSEFVAKEISAALAQGGKKLVPVLFCSTELPADLSAWQWIDLRGQIVHTCDHAAEGEQRVRRPVPSPQMDAPRAPKPSGVHPLPEIAAPRPSAASGGAYVASSRKPLVRANSIRRRGVALSMALVCLLGAYSLFLVQQQPPAAAPSLSHGRTTPPVNAASSAHSEPLNDTWIYVAVGAISLFLLGFSFKFFLRPRRTGMEFYPGRQLASQGSEEHQLLTSATHGLVEEDLIAGRARSYFERLRTRGDEHQTGKS